MLAAHIRSVSTCLSEALRPNAPLSDVLLRCRGQFCILAPDVADSSTPPNRTACTHVSLRGSAARLCTCCSCALFKECRSRSFDSELSDPRSPRPSVRRFEVDTYPSSALLQKQCHVSVFWHCAILWNKNFFQVDSTVDTNFVACDRTYAQWALECVVSLAWFRQQPRDGRPTFCTKCLHMNNECITDPTLLST